MYIQQKKIEAQVSQVHSAYTDDDESSPTLTAHERAEGMLGKRVRGFYVKQPHCDYCNRDFASDFLLRAHLKSVHVGQNKYS